ncbi:tyrosine-type recombinase/integrase [Stenotrophomonas sp. PSU-St83]
MVAPNIRELQHDRDPNQPSHRRRIHQGVVPRRRGQPLSKGQLRSRFDAARARGGVAKSAFRFRDLRAKAGTDKADAAADIRKAQRQLGHSSVVMTETYTRKRKGDRVTPTK